MMTINQHLLLRLNQECLEVAHRVCKALDFGLDELQQGQPFTNEQRILMEYYDLCGVISMLQERGILKIDENKMNMAIQEKKVKVEKYLKYAQSIGTVNNE